jgi:hypothetical protein
MMAASPNTSCAHSLLPMPCTVEPAPALLRACSFDYGVMVCWLLEPQQEARMLKLLKHCQVKPLAPADVQVGVQQHSEQLSMRMSAGSAST